MAASVNNIAATFATVPVPSSSSSSSFPPSSLSPSSFSLSISPQPISASWNPHTTLPRSHKSSLLSLYGFPGPSPPRAISTAHRHHRIIQRPISISAGDKLPNATLSYLDRKNNLHTTTVPALAKGKKLVLIGVSAAFAPGCTRFARAAEEIKSKGVDVVACVAVNDVFVMKAWGKHLGCGDKLMMFSDGHGELCRALGVSFDLGDKPSLGMGTRSRRFCLVALNGIVKSVRLDDGDVFMSAKVDDVLEVL